MKTINRQFLLAQGFDETYVPIEESGGAVGFTYWAMDIFDKEHPDNIIQLISASIDCDIETEDYDETIDESEITVSLFDSMAGMCINQSELTTLIRILKRFDHGEDN